MIDGPLTWFLERGTGVTLVVLLSLTTALGVLTVGDPRGGRPAGGDGGARLPRFVVRALHRNLALLSVLVLAGHVVTSVLHDWVGLRWIDVVVPGLASWQRLGVALGTLATDLVLLVLLTTALRARLGRRAWAGVHLTAWLAWAAGTLHGVLVGTDLAGLRTLQPSLGWAEVATLGSVLLVGLAALARLGLLVRARRSPLARPVRARAGSADSAPGRRAGLPPLGRPTFQVVDPHTGRAHAPAGPESTADTQAGTHAGLAGTRADHEAVYGTGPHAGPHAGPHTGTDHLEGHR
ncbi:hypothetical protein [Nocardioides bruguierae]|uniref:hypothetical protein n=1 Tax=Nocardioides bruguierae TaxID=2945102 RepID=UPI0025477772|nr:hypothetical protein [Nocardioides bruguierae]